MTSARPASRDGRCASKAVSSAQCAGRTSWTTLRTALVSCMSCCLFVVLLHDLHHRDRPLNALAYLRIVATICRSCLCCSSVEALIKTLGGINAARRCCACSRIGPNIDEHNMQNVDSYHFACQRALRRSDIDATVACRHLQAPAAVAPEDVPCSTSQEAARGSRGSRK